MSEAANPASKAPRTVASVSSIMLYAGKQCHLRSRTTRVPAKLLEPALIMHMVAQPTM